MKMILLKEIHRKVAVMHNKFHDFLRFFVVSFVLNIMIILVLNSLINFLVYLNARL